MNNQNQNQNQTLEELEKELSSAKTKLILGIVFLGVAQFISIIICVILLGLGALI